MSYDQKAEKPKDKVNKRNKKISEQLAHLEMNLDELKEIRKSLDISSSIRAVVSERDNRFKGKS